MLHLQNDPAAIGMKRVKTVAKRNGSPGPLRLFRQPLDQSAPLDYQVRMFQGNVGAASIRKQLEASDFVDDASLRRAPEQVSHSIRNDQRALRRLERFDALEHANGYAFTG